MLENSHLAMDTHYITHHLVTTMGSQNKAHKVRKDMKVYDLQANKSQRHWC